MAQTRELECTKAVMPQVIVRNRLLGYCTCKRVHMSVYHYAGLKVVEVAHDMQLVVGHHVR